MELMGDVIITKRRAKELIGSGEHSLPYEISQHLMHKPRIDALVEQMNNGEWDGSKSVIVIGDGTDELLDGRYRLAAFVLSILEVLPTQWAIHDVDNEE
jgi:hypothetical protein